MSSEKAKTVDVLFHVKHAVEDRGRQCLTLVAHRVTMGGLPKVVEYRTPPFRRKESHVFSAGPV